ncbi:MAG: thioredoxin [Clostridia bacterium]
MNDKVKNLTDADFDATIKSDKVTLVDFWATWCPPCKMLAPIIDSVASEIGDKVNIAKVDIDRSPSISSRYRVMSVPTMIIFKDGEVMERMAGVRQKPQILEVLKKYTSF